MLVLFVVDTGIVSGAIMTATIDLTVTITIMAGDVINILEDLIIIVFHNSYKYCCVGIQQN